MFVHCTALKAQPRCVACFVRCTESTYRDTVACFSLQALVDSMAVEKLVVSLHALLDRSGLNPGPWIISASSMDID